MRGWLRGEGIPSAESVNKIGSDIFKQVLPIFRIRILQEDKGIIAVARLPLGKNFKRFFGRKRKA